MKSVLGTMTFGGQVDEAGARAIIDAFVAAGHDHLDTAYIYCDGKTESMLGRLISPPQRGRLHLATKAYPLEDGGLSAASVESQLDTSLKRLNTDGVDLFYLHSPDLDTPIGDTLEACRRLHGAGKFKALGLSNYAAWQVAEIAEWCESKGWLRPEVYQGMYNALTRDVERELFPCLRNYGIAFYAYNPLAGGLLTGKHSAQDASHGGGRFARQQNYRERYWGSAYFEAVESVKQACVERGIALVDAALRWLTHHSLMSAEAGDAVILGATRLDHLEANLRAMQQGPLPDPVVEAFDEGWRITRPVCIKYFRP